MPQLPGTTLDPELVAEMDIQPDPGWRVRLFDDDVTPIDVVVLSLQAGAGLSEEIAEMVMWEAHNEGSAIVRSGLSESEAERICVRLRQHSVIPGLCPGLISQAERDDTT